MNEILDSGGSQDILFFNVASVSDLAFYHNGNALIIADAADTLFENYASLTD
ncbi:hypothetical protein JHL21_02150 [Devosia sp. WQ 349]|uniref:hypothetical protein n=1 Tax=Devosia sp. WQ 349K1 TaxID=2800329 RepID=UPI0019080D7F|nr:hypothetical protein [Devosia sp. WQ 349K1]MBK1793296.1 hypothetical protein [Devosia sp. WQ 349K1]